ncbi:MAG: ATP-dependent DNA helicase RecG [bacterium]
MRLATPISLLKGIGNIQAKRMVELGIKTVGDLLWHVPVRYEDMRPVLDVSRLQPGEHGTIIGTLEQIGSRKTRAGMVLIEAIVRTETGNVPLAWFGNKYLLTALVKGLEYRFSGRVQTDWPRGAAMISSSFELKTAPKIQTGRMLPVYDLTAGVTIKMMRRYVISALTAVKNIPEILPSAIITEYKFPSRAEAFRMLHDPNTPEEAQAAKSRFAFEKMFSLQVASELRRKERARTNAPRVEFHEARVKEFVSKLPYALTNAQRRAAWQILKDIQEHQPMQRILNGDVGSGKTAVAAIACFNAAQSRAQSVLLAPTDILARQHFESFKKLFAHDGGVQIALVTQSARVIACAGSSEDVPKKEFEPLVREGLVSVVIGTHALLEDWVRLPNLALAIVDEQHRFGVAQREALKNLRGDKSEPHFLSMTATPIPRTLHLTFYGDLDISVLDEMPPGRVPVATKIMNRQTSFIELERRLKLDERGYIVCPLIDPSDTLGVKSVEEVLKDLQKRLPKFEFRGLHGRMKAQEKSDAMEWLKERGGRALVSTTVVEVGVDVQAATFIFIEGAERFGLAQLHQLRGRVGRGAAPGFCFLVPSDVKAPTARLAIMEKENSGFRIAEFDLRMRGFGDLLGKSQSGFLPTFKVASWSDAKNLEIAKLAAKKALDEKVLSDDAIADIKENYSLQSA